MKRYLATIAIRTTEARQFIKDAKNSMTIEQWDAVKNKIEDVIIICPQLGKKVVFIDPKLTGNKVKKLLSLCEIIRFGMSFFYDTGTEAIPVTVENYKSISYLKWLDKIPEKYQPEEIN